MRALVAYASKRGSTAEIAEAIAETLRDEGLETDCVPVDQVATLDGYEVVVVGSAVYMARWRGGAKHFLRKHRRELQARRFWMFSSGPVGDPATTLNTRWIEPPNIVELADMLGVRGHVAFGGRVPIDPSGPLERSMVQNTPVEFRDRRDWTEIAGWARGIAAECKVPV